MTEEIERRNTQFYMGTGIKSLTTHIHTIYRKKTSLSIANPPGLDKMRFYPLLWGYSIHTHAYTWVISICWNELYLILLNACYCQSQATIKFKWMCWHSLVCCFWRERERKREKHTYLDIAIFRNILEQKLRASCFFRLSAYRFSLGYRFVCHSLRKHRGRGVATACSNTHNQRVSISLHHHGEPLLCRRCHLVNIKRYEFAYRHAFEGDGVFVKVFRCKRLLSTLSCYPRLFCICKCHHSIWGAPFSTTGAASDAQNSSSTLTKCSKKVETYLQSREEKRREKKTEISSKITCIKPRFPRY